ncbi:MAG: hypothetical protein Q8R16_00065 [bacterium]|nr:hypothetical protein [bacterium]
MSLYLPILKSAWQTALQERRLWGFALFAGFLVGSGFGTAIVQVSGADPTQDVLPSILNINAGSVSRIGPLWAQAVATGPGAAAALVAYGVVILAILLAILWFAVVGVNALVLAAERRSRTASIPRDLRRRAQEHFWPTLVIHCIAKAATIALLATWGAVLTMSAFTATASATGIGVVAFIVTAILLTALHIATPYAIANALLDRHGAVPAIREAFALLRDRWLISVEASLLLSAINALGIIVWLGGSVIVALPFLFLGGIAITNGAGALLTATIAVGITALVAYLALIAMVFTTFLTTAWTLLYLRLTGEGEEPEAWVHRALRSHNHG